MSLFSLDDTKWTDKRGPLSLQIGLATFGILALELALIRWTSSQIRAFAYFNNLVLIGAFLGMGLGIALGKRKSGLLHWTLPALAILAIPLAFSEDIGLMRISFPDQAVFLWGAEQSFSNVFEYIFNLLIFISIFCLIVVVFLFAGSAVGYLFPKIPTLKAYSSDLLGSLLGVIAFTIMTFFNTSPPIWLCIGCLPFLWLSRKPLSLLAFIGVLALSYFSIKGAVFSPYNRIDISHEGTDIKLNVNRDFHQIMHDFSDEKLARKNLTEEEIKSLTYYRKVYEIPFQLNDARGSALILGAGTGNDVQAALRNGYEVVHSVDIDGKIIELGRLLHPEQPYSDPRVIPVVNDARAFFEQYQGEPFDVICFGLVDSHAMFSSMSSLRLDNYVYTVEGIRAAWNHVSDRGHMSISFSVFAGPWIADRLFWTIFKATGKEPIVVFHKMHFGAVYVVAPDMGNLDYDRINRYPRFLPQNDIEHVDTPSDDWPFLYVRPGKFPWAYVFVLAAVLAIAGISTPLAFGRKSVTSHFDTMLFLMGAAFLLIETRGVTSLSLMFGSTWIVNSAIFTGVLIMVLIANLLVERFKLRNPLPWFILLLLAATALWAFDNAALNHLPMLARGLLGGLINALPIGFAGVIVSIFLLRSKNPSASLGSNLLGSVVGGCLEYLSMYFGLKALVLLALIFYFLALLTYLRQKENDQEALTPEH